MCNEGVLFGTTRDSGCKRRCARRTALMSSRCVSILTHTHDHESRSQRSVDDSRGRQAANWTSSLGTLSAQTASGRYMVLIHTQLWSLWRKPAERELTPTDWK